MVLATFRSGVYNTLLLLHIMAAIIGFGGVMLNGVYLAQSKRRTGAERLAISEANEFVSSRIAEMVIYAVFVLGIALVAIGKPVVKFSQGWVGAAIALYIIGLGIAHGVMIPSHRKLNRLVAEVAAISTSAATGGPPPQVAEIDGLEKRLNAGGAVLSLVLIAIVYLMVFKPGGISV